MALRGLMSVFFAALVCAGAACAAGGQYVDSQVAVLQIQGEIVDTHKELILPKEGGAPYFFIGGVTMRIESWNASGPEGSDSSLPPYFSAYMKQNGQNLRAAVTMTACEDILKKHRKPLGLGVHGPLKVRGQLRLCFDTYTDRTQMVAIAEPEFIEGPKGSWTR